MKLIERIRKHSPHVAKRTIIIALIISFFTAFIVAAGTYVYFARDIRNKDRLMNRANTGIVLLDENEQPFFSFYNAKNSTYVNLSQIPKHTQQAVVAAEDRNFYSNPGFSMRGIARALMTNLEHRIIKEGGSTISQELIKISLLSSEKSFLRKYQELVLSIELTRVYTKEEILEMYLNSVYFGEGAFGIQNAAKTYFNKDSKDLTLSESALLIGLLPAPSALSPISNDPAEALERQRYVVNAMAQEGMITKEEAEKILEEEIDFSTAGNNLNVIAPHFALYVKDFLIERYGEERIIRSGFKVKTTLNTEWQKYAQETLKNQVISLKESNASNGAVVIINPSSGHIKAMVGSYNWYDESNGKINMTIRPRQPGSSFKPIIYSEALEKKIITPATILNDSPIKYADGYEPQNYDRFYRGPVTVRRALANSLNIPAVEVMDKLGVQDGLEAAKDFGITSLEDPERDFGLSLVLGSGEVSLLEMTNAYAAFANKGKNYETTSITHIDDKYKQNIYTHKEQERSVLSEAATFLISSILSDSTVRAETFGNALSISKNAAVKTGTSEEYRDSLTIGYTQSIVVGVWVGNNDNTPMNSIAGSLGAAPVWRQIMETVLANTPTESFDVPSGIVKEPVCFIIQAEKEEEDNNEDDDEDESDNNTQIGKYEEYFLKGTEPKDCWLQGSKPPIIEENKEEKENKDQEDKKKDENQEEEDDDDEEDEEDTEEATQTPTP